MNKFEAMNQFNLRWNIKLNNEEKFKQLKDRVNAMLQNKLGNLIFSEEIEEEFIELIGMSKIPVNKPNIALLQGWKMLNGEESKILKRLMDYEKEIDYFKGIQILFLSKKIDSREKENLYEFINKVINVSGYSNIVGVRKDGKYGYIVCPIGDKILDEKVINKSLKNIEKYNTTYMILINTLEKYSLSENSGTENVDIIDNLRKILENYLKEKFNSSKQSIDKILKEDVGRYLANKNIDINIRNMYINLGTSIEKFSNENTKHRQNLNITRQEVELFIYMVGTLVRFLESINDQRIDGEVNE